MLFLGGLVGGGFLWEGCGRGGKGGCTGCGDEGEVGEEGEEEEGEGGGWEHYSCLVW